MKRSVGYFFFLYKQSELDNFLSCSKIVIENNYHLQKKGTRHDITGK